MGEKNQGSGQDPGAYIPNMFGQDKNDRHIRVFISSTFLDMQAERDHLVKFVFPQLRKICESRGVIWGEVDLRWGITDEQRAEGKVLPICLEEIKRCRPYFIGLLGERYGWIPDEINPDVIEQEPWLNQHLHGKTSVTELEIIHGVLREELMHGHAFFYFRDPKFIETLAEDKRQDFMSEDVQSSEKLKRLKNRIRCAHDKGVCELRQNFFDPQELGRWIIHDFTQLIDRLFPEDSQPDPLSREAMDHNAYARRRERIYIGRSEYFDRLDAHTIANNNQPLVILGESGSGKSALLANWTAKYQQSHPDVLFIQHYIGATPNSCDWTFMLRRILNELKQRFEIAEDLPDDSEALRDAFSTWLHLAASRGRIILVLDGLNQLEDHGGAPDLLWLPLRLPENVQMFLSTLPGRALDEITKRSWPTLEIESLSVDERKKLIHHFLHACSRELSPAMLDRIANAEPAANPLYLTVLLDELRVFGRHDHLRNQIEYYLKATSPNELYDKVITRWEEDYGIDLVRDSLSIIWAARQGLSESELVDVMGQDDKPMPLSILSPFMLAADASLMNRSGMIGFNHDFLSESVRSRYLATESSRHSIHYRLAEYFARRDLGHRKLDELPWQLEHAGQWEKLRNLLADMNFLFALLNSDRHEEVMRYWTALEAHPDIALEPIFQPILERPESYRPVLPQHLSLLLEYVGRIEEALELRKIAADGFRKAGALPELAMTLVQMGSVHRMRSEMTQALACVSESVEISRTLDNEGTLVYGLEAEANIRWEMGELDSSQVTAGGAAANGKKIWRSLDYCESNRPFVIHYPSTGRSGPGVGNVGRSGADDSTVGSSP